MIQGRGGMGSTKHGKSGHATKSPRLRFKMKMEAEKNERKSKSGIIDPKQSVSELLNKTKFVK